MLCSLPQSSARVLHGNKRVMSVTQKGTNTPHLVNYPKQTKWYNTIPDVEVLNFVDSSFDVYSNRSNFLGLDNIFCCHLGIAPQKRITLNSEDLDG